MVCLASRPAAPEFLAQTGEAKSAVDRRSWIELMAAEARKRGCTFSRATFDTGRDLLLFEAWLTRPVVVPEPHFQFVTVRGRRCPARADIQSGVR